MNGELLRHIELIIGSIGVILGVFFASFLFVTRLNQPKANLFLSIYLFAFSLRIGKSLFHNFFEIDATLRAFFLGTLLCVGPSIWLYSLYLINPEPKKKLKDFIHFTPFIIIVGTFWLIPNNGSWIFALFYDFLTAHMFCYTMFSLIWFKKQKRNTTIKENVKVEQWLNYFLLMNIVLIVMYFLISELIIPFYIGLSFLFSMMVIFLSFFALKNPFMFKVSLEKYRHSTIDSNEAIQLIKQLKSFIDKEKPFLDSSLTLVKLSEKVGASSKELSQAINQIESLNYSQFISKYRVEEARRLMRSDPDSKLTIAAIAYDSGFNSISSFNTLFKKFTNTKAIDYRRSLKIQ